MYFFILRMSNWDRSDLEAEDFDPNKDYSVQVQRKDGGLASTQRCLQKIAESEELGAQTAAELHRQREALERTKERLNESEATLRESESHMKSIKSFWGQMHQKWFGPKIKDDKDKTKKTLSTTPCPEPVSNSQPSSSFSSISTSGDHLQSRTSSKAPTTRDEQINHNLGQMSDGLSRLKNLGLTLQTELDAQDDLIDDVDAAVQRNQLKTNRLNKNMNQLLKK